MPINSTVKLCGAKSRQNNHQPCRQPGMLTNGRCRMHGGKSTGPKTPEGKKNSAEANRIKGLLAKMAKVEKLQMRTMMSWRGDLYD